MPRQQLLGSVVEDRCTSVAVAEEEDEDSASSTCRRPSSPCLLQQISTLFRLGDNDTSFEDDDAIEEDPITLKYDTYLRTRGKRSSSSSSSSSSIPATEAAQEEEEEDQLLRLALVSQHHSLWAEYVYNAARVLADRIDDGRIDCRRMRCLELGE